MATIQDIFDWLNQGAQGDIPGTGGEQPNAPTASAPAQPVTPAAAMPSQPSPQDFADGIPPGLMDQYNALVQGGVPPQMAHQILMQPQQQQGQKSQTGEEKKGGLQGSDAYKAGQSAGTGLEHLFFGAPPTQQGGQTQDHQGLIDMLSNWFSPSPQQSDWSG